MFIPRAGDQKQDNENDQPLFCPRENKDTEEPFHLPA
jgi:hypothetical protein